MNKQIKRQQTLKKGKPKHTIKDDCKQFFIHQTGNTKVQDAEFQQVSAQDQDEHNSENHEDFYLEEEQTADTKGIKTAQFWNSMVKPSDAAKVSDEPVDISFRCPVSFGFNSLGRDNILMIEGEICKAVGCLIIFNEQIYEAHNSVITSLAFNKKTNQLMSATEGQTSFLFLWQYDPLKKILIFVKQFFISGKCEPIYALSFCGQNHLLAIQKFTLNKHSNLHCFNKISGTKETIKVGKFYDIELLQAQDEQNDRIFFSNNQGIIELKINNQNSLETQIVVENGGATCICAFYAPSSDELQLQIIYGDKQGNITFSFLKSVVKAHEGWIFQLKCIRQQGSIGIFALGALDLKLSILKYEQKKAVILHTIQLEGYGRSLYLEENKLLIGKRDGSHDIFLINELFMQQNDQPLKAAQLNKKQYQSIKCYQTSKFAKQHLLNCSKNDIYVYGNEKSKSIYFFKGLQNNSQMEFQQYDLRYFPTNFDINGDLIAYTYDVEKQADSPIKTLPSKNKKKQFTKTILVLQNYLNKKCICKVSLNKSQQNQSKQFKCTSLKFSPTGKFIAMGYINGEVSVCNFLAENNSNMDENNIVFFEKKHSDEEIEEIVWSKDQKMIKTSSKQQVYYWKIGQKKDQLEIKTITNKQVKECRWTSMDRFGWETKQLWQHQGSVNDVYKYWYSQATKLETRVKNQISTQRRRIIGCSRSDGTLRLYNYLPNFQECYELKVHRSRFQVCSFMNQKERLLFWMAFEGILVLVQVVYNNQPKIEEE